MSYKKSKIPDFTRAARQLQAVAFNESAKEIRVFAETQKTEFVDKVEKQQFESFIQLPLSPAYLKRKIAKGRGNRTMIATKTYVQNIKVFVTRKAQRVVAFRVGFNPRTLARDLDGRTVPFPLYKVAVVQEHGSVKAHVPARPHWGPHLISMRTAAKKALPAMASRIRFRAIRAFEKNL